MTNMLALTKARRNLSELVNQAYYEGRLFGIAKGNKAMGAFVGAREWREIIRVLEVHDPSLADTLAIMADPGLQAMLDEDEVHLKRGTTVTWKQVTQEIQEK